MLLGRFWEELELGFELGFELEVIGGVEGFVDLGGEFANEKELAFASNKKESEPEGGRAKMGEVWEVIVEKLEG